jgi:hypothetical protein
MSFRGLKVKAVLVVLSIGALVPVASCGNQTSTASAAKNVCGDPETYNTIKEIVFDNAVSAALDDTVQINDWRKLTILTVEYPLLKDVNQEISRTDCAGRLILSIPETERPKFDGTVQLKADITYYSQPSADGTGNVISVDGFNPVVNKIVEANANQIGLAQARRNEQAAIQETAKARAVASRGGPQLQRTYNPSFDCGRKLNNVERMICQDEGLADLDRSLSANFRSKISTFDEATKQDMLSEQRGNLAVRGNCSDIACLYDWYETNKNWVNNL